MPIKIYRVSFTVPITLLLVVMIGAQSTAKEAPISSNWSAFVSEEANFSALFPGIPKATVVDVMTTPIKRQNHWFEVIGPIYFAVCYSDHPMLPSFDDSSLEKNYDFLRDNVVRSTKAELVKDEKVQVDSHSGREVTVRLGSSTAVSRFFLVNKRLYQAIVSFKTDRENEKDTKEAISKFLNSFSVGTKRRA